MTPENRVRGLLAAGDQEAAASEAIRWLGPATLRLLRGAVPDEEDASDAFSLWEETLWRSLPRFRSEGRITHWSQRIARTAARRIREEAWRRHGCRLSGEAAEELEDGAATDSALQAELRRRLLEELRVELTVEEQRLLCLRVDHELAWTKVARVLSKGGAPVDAATLTKRFQRLKARLALLARARGLTD